MKDTEPNSTLPRGFGDPQFKRFIAHRLDDHFEPIAAQLSAHYLAKVKRAMELDCHKLAWEFACAAAHWRTVSEDRLNGAKLMEES